MPSPMLLPADIAVFVAAVADWRVSASADNKIKKKEGEGPAPLELTENPDILRTIGHHPNRPELVVGFAAETADVIANAQAKLARKGADFIVANDVSPDTGIMGGDRNRVRIVSKDGVEDWPDLSKDEVAARLAARIAELMPAKKWRSLDHPKIANGGYADRAAFLSGKLPSLRART
jgi:phosphopantothenoylcysteine decarboxylase/phosphopantothenate--cysteine ligase